MQTNPEGTKLDIMKLLIKQELSAQELADLLALTPAGVRQHLDTLEALGLVMRRKRITQPSRPTYLYRLSSRGSDAFPRRYDLLLSLILDAMRDEAGPAAVDEIVAAAARRLAESVHAKVTRGEPPRRWAALLEWLEENLRWQADVAADGSRHRIVIHQCPFREVSSAEPAVCGVFFRTLIATAWGDAAVDHVPGAAPPACCSLLVDLRNPRL